MKTIGIDIGETTVCGIVLKNECCEKARAKGAVYGIQRSLLIYNEN